MTPIYIRNDNLKKIWELLDVWVEFGFGTVCAACLKASKSDVNNCWTFSCKKTSYPELSA